MNAQIVRLFGVIVVLFALLVFFASRWSVFDASALNDNPLNSREAIAQLKIKRGRILADNDAVLARSVSAGSGTWRRVYPFGSLFAQPVGYSTGETGNAAGLEVSRAKELRGIQTGIQSILGPLGPTQQVGDDVYTTLDPRAQEAARAGLDGRIGSVVAIDPRSGAILAMYSNPSYDPAHPNESCSNDCQYNRATLGNYPPGSTFKIVTATAAIDSGKFTPDSVLDGNSPQTISGVPLNNDDNQSWGPVTLTKALTQSINTVFARVAVDVGIPKMTEYMQRFGFYEQAPLDYPSDEIGVSRPFSPAGEPFPAGSQDEDIGRIGIGQGGLEVSPLQMAMVVSAIADGGMLMVPHFTSKVVNQDGQTVETIAPKLWHRVASAQTAQQVNEMMRTVVDEGTGTAAQLGNGIQFAGKTGTASKGPAGSGETQPWFVGFAPADAPQVAIAVDIETTQGEYGGQVAAPIARDVVQTLLAEGR